jgi:hypothetical protein
LPAAGNDVLGCLCERRIKTHRGTILRVTPKVDRLHQYWISLARSHAATAEPATTDPILATADYSAPPRYLLDPAEIQSLLPEIVLVAFETDPFRVRFRLTGTQVDESNGVNLTHTYLDEFDDGHDSKALAPLIESYHRAWQQAQAVIFTYRWRTLRGQMIDVCCGIFPLAIDTVVREAVAIEEYEIADVLDRPLPLRRR